MTVASTISVLYNELVAFQVVFSWGGKGMNKVVLKPSFGMVVATWLIICFGILLVMILMNPAEYGSNLALLGMVAAAMAIRAFIMSIIFYLIPYLRIEVNDAGVKGPGSLFSWNQVKIPLANFESRRVIPVIPWLGFYRIGSEGFGTITIWWFDRQQLLKLLDAVSVRKSPGSMPARAAAGSRVVP